MLITEKPETVFDTSEIKAGYLVFAKNRSWNEGIAGFVTAVTDKDAIAFVIALILNLVLPEHMGNKQKKEAIAAESEQETESEEKVETTK